MGWKGTVRSLQAAGRQAQREAAARQRERERQQKQLAKMAELERAGVEVELFEEYVSRLVTIHATEVEEVDWAAIAEAEQPATPERTDTKEKAAKVALASFKPRLLESKKRQAARREGLESQLAIAADKDRAEYQSALTQHQSDVEAWRSSKQLAVGVLAGEVEALAEAAKQIQGMAGGEMLRYVQIEVSDMSPTVVSVGVAPIEDVVPTEQKSLLASGKLSVKQMPNGQYFALYQDYVCGSALLVANTILGMLPLPELIVTAQSEMLNTSTGHIEESPILSMFVPRSTVGRLNLTRVDASDAMSNFSHNMKFVKTRGFRPVEPITAPTDNTK